MLEEAPKTIWIITESTPLDGARVSGDVGGVLRPPQYIDSSTQVRSAVPIEKLKKEMEDFLRDLGDIFSSAEHQLEQQKTGMCLDEIELSVEVNGEGQIGLFGVGGKAGGKGAITLKFKREKPLR
jgi:hypothetical protein